MRCETSILNLYILSKNLANVYLHILVAKAHKRTGFTYTKVKKRIAAVNLILDGPFFYFMKFNSIFVYFSLHIHDHFCLFTSV